MHFNIKLLLLSLLKNRIFSISLPKAIDAAAVYSEILSFNALKTYDLSDIETYLLFEATGRIEIEKLKESPVKTPLFVVTEPYLTGGHTRLMENLSLMMPLDSHLLITADVDSNVKLRLHGFFSDIDSCLRFNDEDSISYIKRIVNKLIMYEVIILNIHVHDIWTTLACGIAKKINKDIKIFFVNHADHVASYGAVVADTWYQISLSGIETDKLRNIRGTQTFLGIPINKSDDAFFNSVKYPEVRSNSVFCTAASSVKYKPYKKDSIIPLIVRILREYPASSIHIIGVDVFKSPWWWLVLLKYHGRINIHRSLPYEQYLDLTKNSDFYIDSHPMPGGTAFVEQFLQGVPCIGIKSGHYGYTPLELIKSKNYTGVLNMLNNPPGKSKLQELQRYIFDVHAFSNVKKRLLSSIYDDVQAVSPMMGYSDQIITNVEVKAGFGLFYLSKKLVKFSLVLR